MAMKIEFYVWSTRQDSRVREGHAERNDMIFRWDMPPEGGHPTEDFGCRCYARALGIEGCWARVRPSVEGSWQTLRSERAMSTTCTLTLVDL
ncbi:MAG: phage minor head protein [Tabrizicola sp.]|uniref:phage minor head protein n=1 Tax=Tabrizicola sp. TaxID=2005166 RepID=UPI002736000E|nr:phage minor head protein [Tabrizicola sp.]MDP3648347.1 phage minor head protein [Paracoccaceae bacterium]MDZ4067742.1 phage minor head protein [Tabrizicola sp.]